MVSKKLATRLAKKKNELANAENRVKVLKEELATLNQQVQLELVKQLQTNLKTYQTRICQCKGNGIVVI